MRSRRVLLVGILCMAVAGLARADGAVTPPSRDEVLKFMDVLHIKSQLNQYFDGVVKQAKLGAQEGFRQKMPRATPAQLAEVGKVAEEMFRDMPVDEMVEAMVPIYQKHLTQADLEQILAFYASPVGQKLQREQPAMTQEGMQAGGEIGRRRIGVMIERLDAFVAKFAKEQQQPAPRH